MKFKLNTTGTFYSSEEATKLRVLGFKFRTTKEVYGAGAFTPQEFYKDHQDVEVEISTLEDLLKFISSWGECIIDDNSITIYDDYA